MRARRGLWAGRAIAGVILVGLAVYLKRAGFDRADKIASALSLLVAVLALVLPYLLPPKPPPADDDAAPGMQGVSNVTTGGRLAQIRNVRGNVRTGAALGRRRHRAQPPAPLPSATPPCSAGRRQTVEGAVVGDDLMQIDGVDGDVSLE